MCASSREGLTKPSDHNNRKVKYNICDKTLTAATLQSRLVTQYNIYRSSVIDQDLLVDIAPVTYHAIHSVHGRFTCPVPDCVGYLNIRYKNLQQHFQVQHPLDLVNIVGKGFFPQCTRCGMQTKLTETHHQSTKNYDMGYEHCLQRKAAKRLMPSLQENFWRV